MKYEDWIGLFHKKDNYELLLKGNWGLEKESMRIDGCGNLVLTPHPAIFGDKLENPNITTDFSESQIEMVTDPFDSIEKVLFSLSEIQGFILENLDGEFLWPLSMPPHLPDKDKIPIAKFNGTAQGRINEIYRNGLSLRYGKKMQMISGIHYNFSFPGEFWDFLIDALNPGIERQVFIDKSYFSIARNFLRYRWLLIYLFGASPTADISFIDIPGGFKKIQNLKYFTASLRMSSFGYSSGKQEEVRVSYNSLDEYTEDLEKSLITDSKEYKKIGVCRGGRQIQLNPHVLQKESEFYSPVRIKSAAHKGESHLDNLKSGGVSYIEIRSVDLNPFYREGISLDQLYFYHMFLLYCLFMESGYLSGGDLKIIKENDELTALYGRKNGIELIKDNGIKAGLTDWAEEILTRMILVADLLDSNNDSNRFLNIILSQKLKIHDKTLLPSSRIVKEMTLNNESHADFGTRLAKSFMNGVDYEYTRKKIS